MDAVLAFGAAVVASAFVLSLIRAHLQRPRPHVAAWSVAMAMYAIATWALFVGLSGEWTDGVFRVFYLFGAILNVMFLALGSAFLVLGSRAGAVLLVVLSAFSAGAAAVALTASFEGPLPTTGVPAGSDIFASLSEGIGTPRLWALVANSAGTLLLVGLAIYSVIRYWKVNRRLARGNLLIVAGTVAPALGGSLTGLGEASALAASLLVGALLLYGGYSIASTARAATRSSAEKAAARDDR